MKNILGNLSKLPPAAKFALAGGGGLAIFWLFNTSRNSAASSSATTAAADRSVIYPYAVNAGSDISGGSGGGSVASVDTSNLVTMDQFAEWNNSIADSIASLQDKSYSDMLSTVGGAKSDDMYYLLEPTTPDPNLALQKAQAAYGAAKTPAEKAAAAAAGKAARDAGATDAGAAAIWTSLAGNKTTSNKTTTTAKTSTTLTANQKLQQAQAAYGAAKTPAEKAAAAAAGKAARAAGATDAGAAAVWKSISGK